MSRRKRPKRVLAIAAGCFVIIPEEEAKILGLEIKEYLKPIHTLSTDDLKKNL